MQMNRDYRLATYALALASVLLLASGAAVVSGVGISDSITDAERPDTASNETDTDATVIEAEQVDTRSVDSESITFVGSTDACGGLLRVDAPNHTRTDVQVDGGTATLVEEHDGEPFDEIPRERFAQLVWDETTAHAGLDEYDHLEVHVNQYYESTNRDEPLVTTGITVRPVDSCLPTVRGEVNLANETVDVRHPLPELESVDLRVTDSIGVLSEEDEQLLSSLLVSDENVSYLIQKQFENPDRLDATVLEATNDGQVDIELTSQSGDARAVVVTVDLETERVVRSHVRLEFDESNVELIDTTAVNESVSVEAESPDGDITFETNSTDRDT
jgi:hypothetical protein